MRRRGLTLPEFAVLFAVLVILVAILWPPGMGRTRHNARRVACIHSLKHVALACLMYQKDYSGRLPLVAVSDAPNQVYGWADATITYLSDSAPSKFYQCVADSQRNGADPRKLGYTDYWFNRNVSGLSVKAIKKPQQTLILGEGDGASLFSTSRYAISSLPASWHQKDDSPVQRHLGGANYAFVDGHVKWYRNEKIETALRSGKEFSFSSH